MVRPEEMTPAQVNEEAQMEIQTLDAELAAENALLREKLLDALLRACAMAAGVRNDRMNVLCRLAQVKDIDPLAEDASIRINDAVQAVLAEMPELAAAPAAAAFGALGQHPRVSKRNIDPFSRGFRG